jgi:hypothetical protein
MEKKLGDRLILKGALILFFALPTLPLAGMNLGTVQAQMKPAGAGQITAIGSIPAPFSCDIIAIAVLEEDNTTLSPVNRIQVLCNNSPGGGVFLFAVSTLVNGVNANRYLAVLNTAVALGKPVTIYYENDYAKAPAGCPTNCRKLTGLGLAK